MIDPHNNYLSLSRPELEDQNAEYALQVKEENSQRAFVETINPCSKYAANKLPILFRNPTQAEQDLRDGITMECWANEYMNRRSTDPLLARRQEGLAKAHEYFFLPTPSKE